MFNFLEKFIAYGMLVLQAFKVLFGLLLLALILLGVGWIIYAISTS